MPCPDYQGNSLVNLMSSLSSAMGKVVNNYPVLESLSVDRLANNRNIILLVIDGLGYEYLLKHGQGSCLHDHIAGKMTSVFPSTTATAITTFMTGLAPQQHGLTGWFTYLKELGCITAVLPFKPRVGMSNFNPEHLDANSLYGHTPIFDLLPWTSYVVAPEWIIHSEYNVAHSGAALLHGYNNLSECFNNIQSIVNSTDEHKYIYAYWPDFDRYSHETGCTSSKVHSHFAELDAEFDSLLKKLAGTDTSIIVTADHGFIDTAPDRIIHLHDHPIIQESLVMPLSGEPRAAYCYVHPGKENQFIDYIKSELEDCIILKPSQTVLDEGYFGIGESHPKLHERIGHYTLLMKDNFIIKDQLVGERAFAHIGVHGGVSSQEMYVPLIYASC
ncbi:MAG: alkaline phosphatase family protein [Gammaproteobacteria bacterium]|nr:alkaline phosphatase family protein [Gammaproteobacteria bacterium]